MQRDCGMEKLGIVEDTLFVPMSGRIYASEKCKAVLYDKKALELNSMIPAELMNRGRQSEYTQIASASRSANMDRYIRDFMKREPDGIIVQLGCGLETAFFRDDNGTAQWYEVDLPHVIEFRRKFLPESERDVYIAGNALEDVWIRQIRKKHPDSPLLITASGLFYYFTEETVLALFKLLQGYGNIEIVFDTVSKSGMSMMRKKYMKEIGHADAQMFFYVQSASELETKTGGTVKVLTEEPYYRYIPRNGLQPATRISMNVSDLLGMVKMIHLALYEEGSYEIPY